MYSPESLVLTTLFESPSGDEVSNQNYRDVVLRTLRKNLPTDFFEYQENEEETLRHQKRILQEVIPMATCSGIRQFPGTLSFFSLSKYRPNSFKFFFEMISRWLTPGRRLNVVLVYASDFRLTRLSEEIYTMCEVMISLSDEAEFQEIQRHFPIIESEIMLGIHSEFYAQRILEIRGLSADDKTALIQGFIAFLIKRFPKIYDTDVFTEMQHILVTCRDDFKANRTARHLSRIISIQYLFRKGLREGIKKNAKRRHLNLKIFRAHIGTSNGRKKVLSILVGFNFFREQEAFGQRHLIKAIQEYVPTASPVDHSFFLHKWGSDNMCMAYIEIEKREEGDFSIAETRKLRRELPTSLKNRIEQRLQSVFMPRNEEEVMRNMVILSNQLKYMRDIPQVLVMFDEQADAHLYFTIILARIVKSNHQSIGDLFKLSDGKMEYLHDRTKIVGYVGKKYPKDKEASVFRLKFSKEGFLRADHSIDLYKARQAVILQLSQIFGEIRDYNGGMLSKQNELLVAIRRLLIDCKGYDEFLLENFFYSLSPVVARALLDPLTFKTLFLMLQTGIKEYKQEGYYFKFHREHYNAFALVIIEDSAIKDFLIKAIHDIHIPAAELVSAHIKLHGNICLGYICCVHDMQKKEQFYKVIEQTLKGTTNEALNSCSLK
jgi:hypothetical protein